MDGSSGSQPGAQAGQGQAAQGQAADGRPGQPAGQPQQVKA
jgi:hypothetical protein